MKGSMKSALRATMTDETTAFQSRLAKADAVLAKPTSPSQPVHRVIRDSFSMPENDYERIAANRARALKQGVAVTKAEVLRAGLIAVSNMSDAELVEILGRVEKIKTGRPNTI